MTFDLKLDEARLIETKKLLKNIPNGAEIALMRALNRGVEKIRTEAVKYICARYTIKAAKVRQHLRVVKATRNNLQASIIFSSATLPIANFKYKPKVMRQKGIPVSKRKHLFTEIKSGSLIEWPHAFLATMSSGHTGIFSRIKGTRKIKELHTLSIPQMASYQEIMRVYLDAGMQRMRETLNQQVAFMLQTGRTSGKG